MPFYVYVLYSSKLGKSYVGSTSNLETRTIITQCWFEGMDCKRSALGAHLFRDIFFKSGGNKKGKGTKVGERQSIPQERRFTKLLSIIVVR